MDWPILVSGALALIALAALLYWQLNLAEGVYLGRQVVVWLYDRFAPRYDAVKQFNEYDEARFLGGPLAQALLGLTTSLVLDVATGTGRMPLALLKQQIFTGRVVALDLSREMLRRAAAKTEPFQDRVTLLWQDATWIPFPDNVFDAVTCLEALEFLPDARTTLAEMVRVLRPGGILFVSNRVGPGAKWLPGRTMDRQTFTALLQSLSLENVHIAAWQVDYDIAWARKYPTGLAAQPHQPAAVTPSTLPLLLRCPSCTSGPLTRQADAFYCNVCNSRYPIADDGVVEMGF